MDRRPVPGLGAERVLDRHVTHELSLGDFVLSGGELPALALLDAVARLQEGVHQQERNRHAECKRGVVHCD